MWSYSPFWGWYWPFDCLIRPGTAQADALINIMNNHPDLFHSNVMFSDGSVIPSSLNISNRWIGPFNSGEDVLLSNMWFEEGTREIRVKAKDEHGAETEFVSMPINVPKNRMHPFFYSIAERLTKLHNLLFEFIK
jgi:hypothetical protein